MKNVLFFISTLLSITAFFSNRAQAQSARPLKYWVEFTDKNNSPWSVHRPWEFLSARALERRARAGIAVLEDDLPVHPDYLGAIRRLGITVHGTSRWLNAAAIIADSAGAARIADFPFVKKVSYIGPHLRFRNPPNRPDKKRVPLQDYPRPGGERNPWGYAARQNSLLNVNTLHAAGHRGKGVWIAVMDGGFSNVDTLPFFDSTALGHRLFPGFDFVERDRAVYESAGHGSSVLSVMASNMPGYYVGTAPDATYFLLKTEDTGGEFPIEEANWVAGAEWADSIGCDIINASLGYTAFNDPQLGHRYGELDGRTAIASRGAVIAAQKGMLVCNSAGNEGDGEWRYIGAPADAPGLIAVGAVDLDGNRAAFSSVGPTADGRIKPDLMAPGQGIIVCGYHGIDPGMSDGTSLASPMLAGGLAALWSAYPDKTAAEITASVFRYADQWNAPDNERGYGLPDLAYSWLHLGGYLRKGLSGYNHFFAYDPLSNRLDLLVFETVAGPEARIELSDIHGKILCASAAGVQSGMISRVSIEDVPSLPAGVYRVKFLTPYGVSGFWIHSTRR